MTTNKTQCFGCKMDSQSQTNICDATTQTGATHEGVTTGGTYTGSTVTGTSYTYTTGGCPHRWPCGYCVKLGGPCPMHPKWEITPTWVYNPGPTCTC